MILLMLCCGKTADIAAAIRRLRAQERYLPLAAAAGLDAETHPAGHFPVIHRRSIVAVEANPC
jgi:hypothetical protein